MPCPVDTTLQFAKICGSVQEICAVGDPQNLRVTIDLINPEGGALTDPTTDAFVVGGRIFDDLILDSTDGCWCTCDLLVNTAADPAMSLQPNNTAYKITVRWGTTTVIDGLQFQLDADTIGNFTLDNNAECGDCINISDLVDIPVLPPAATFCDQVDACVTDLQAQADGNTAAIAALVDNDTVSVVTDNLDGTWTHDDGNGNTVDIVNTNTTNASAALTGDTTDGLTVTVTDSAGIPVTGNLPYADLCTLIQTCLPTDEDWTLVDDGAGTVTFTHPTDPQSPITITSDDDSSYEVAGDGTITITFDDGSAPLVIPPASAEQGQAVVTDNTDGTTTITGTSTGGAVTSDTVLNNVLVNDGAVGSSRDIDPDVDILLHDGNVADFSAIDAAATQPVGKLANGTLAVGAPSGIKLLKAAEDPGPYFESQEITYSFTVVNTGQDVLTNVQVTDPQATVLGAAITLNPGQVDGTNFTGTYTVTAADVAAGGVYNLATVSATDPQGNVVTNVDDDTVLVSECVDQAGCGFIGAAFSPFLESVNATQVANGYDIEFSNGAIVEFRLTSGDVDITKWNSNLNAIQWSSSDGAQALTHDFEATLRASRTAAGCVAPMGLFQFAARDIDTTGDSWSMEDVTTGVAPVANGVAGGFTTASYGNGGVTATAIADSSDVRITTTVNNPIDGHVIAGNYTDVGGNNGDLISYVITLRGAEAADVVLDCLGNLLSATDVDGDAVADLNTVTVI